MGNLSHTTGSVSIGTSTPVANTPLLVQGIGDGAATIRLQIAGSGGSLNYGSMIVSGTQASSTVEPKWINSFVLEGVPLADSTGASGSTIISSFDRNLQFHTGQRAERMRITTSGDVGIGTNAPTTKLDVNGGVKISGVLNVNEISGFTASGGIRFPTTAVNSSDVNTLDDYEEGTWTPSLTFNGANPTTITYNTTAGAYARSGVYVKIGRLVWCHGRIQLTALSGAAAGFVRITGLPFAAANPTSVHPTGTVPYYVGLAAAITTPPGLYVDALDPPTVRLVKNGAGTVTNMANTDFTSGTDIMFNIVYST